MELEAHIRRREVRIVELEAEIERYQLGQTEAPPTNAEPVLGAQWDGHDSFTPLETFEILHVSRNCGYSAGLPFIRVGKRLVMPRVRLEKLLRG